MKLRTWMPVLFCVAAVFPAVAAKIDNKDYPAVPEDVSMFEDDKAPNGFSFQSSFGFPFYVTDQDSKDKSTCVDKCVETWAPVKARDNATPIGKDWTLVSRPEGYKQWAWHGKPIYINMAEVLGGTLTIPKNSPWHPLVP